MCNIFIFIKKLFKKFIKQKFFIEILIKKCKIVIFCKHFLETFLKKNCKIFFVKKIMFL